MTAVAPIAHELQRLAKEHLGFESRLVSTAA